MVNYYVDPGSGFVFTQNVSFLWGVILGSLGAFAIFFRFFFNFFKKFFWIFFILLIILIIGGIMKHKAETGEKVIIIGIDAMDPKITEQLMKEGKLPNFTYLKNQGAYSNLATAIPAESVVVWTSFMTGLNPGDHDIFSFIMRNPDDYFPYLSLNEISKVSGKIKIKLRSKGLAFWDTLSKNRIRSYIYFCPNTFPARPISGKMLSGMGVPDISGTMGKYSFYTTAEPPLEDDPGRRGRIVRLEGKTGIINTSIYGPKVELNGSVKESTIPLKVSLFPDKDGAAIDFQGNHFFLKKNDWSGWQKVSFKVGLFKRLHGIVRFHLNSVRPELELYASPINFDPEKPPFPISYPYDFSQKLAKKTGPYYTQGMPYDTGALSDGALDDKAFLELTDEILNENEKILHSELKEFKGGAFFFYFETLDAVQHMFWRYLDPRHPLYESGSPYQDTISRYYEKMDRILGEILKNIDKDTTLIILSDHGFSSFRRAVHLNSWLLKHKYLYLKEGAVEGGDFLEDIDWSKTKAYALGFGGIYLNKAGRERDGIISESEAGDLKLQISEGLKQFRDLDTGEAVVSKVYNQEEAFQGRYAGDSPDLFVGFNAGYRASWQTALGGAPNALLEDNKRKWSGDHLIDPALVPGVVFINKKIDLGNPSIIDMAPSILKLFNTDKPEEMKGKSLFK